VQRFLDRFHEPISGFTHLGGALLAGLGMVWLIALTWDAPAKMLSVIVYSISMILMFSASTALHLPKVSDRVRNILNRLDHSAIYLMIAGSYTPFLYNVLQHEGWRWGSLWVIWLLAAAGVIYKLFLYRKNNSVSTLTYIAMGWLALALIPQALPLLPPVVTVLILSGGIVYSVGAVIFSIRKPNFHRYFGFHELWHIFVLGGSALHFAALVIILWR
jgi:hemolysin III